MSIREIITIPGPTLRKKARKVTDFGPELQLLIEDMIETMPRCSRCRISGKSS